MAPTSTRSPPPGKLVWSVQLPISYPSDPQQLGPEPLPGRRLHHPRRDLRIQPRRQDPLVLPPLLRERDAQPPEPRRAAAGRLDRRQRRLPRPGRDHRPAKQEDRLAIRPYGSPGPRPRPSPHSRTVSTCWPRTGPPRPTRIRAERELLRRPGGGELFTFSWRLLGRPVAFPHAIWIDRFRRSDP